MNEPIFKDVFFQKKINKNKDVSFLFKESILTLPGKVLWQH